MTDPTNDLERHEKHVEELLLRAARLDVPHGITKQRALAAGLAALGECLQSELSPTRRATATRRTAEGHPKKSSTGAYRNK